MRNVINLFKLIQKHNHVNRTDTYSTFELENVSRSHESAKVTRRNACSRQKFRNRQLLELDCLKLPSFSSCAKLHADWLKQLVRAKRKS